MSPKIDSVKINVKREASKKKSAPKKRVASKKIVSKKQISLLDEVPQKITSTNSSNQFISLFISIIITAVVVGGGISVVQKLISSKHIMEAKNETENVKSEFQTKLEELKNKLQGTESENEELKNKEEKLAHIISNAKREYENKNLGISFSYPASFGEVTVAYENGDAGKNFIGSFSEFNKLVFGGVTKDYSVIRKLELIDTQGYRIRSGKYYFKSIGEGPDVYEFEPFKILEVDDTEIPVIDKEDFMEESISAEATVDEESSEVVIEQKNKILALVNLEGEEYTGMAFLDNDTEELPLDDFEGILNSIAVEKPIVEENVVE
jgi:uncharacterized FlaG/YvyC family protein